MNIDVKFVAPLTLLIKFVINYQTANQIPRKPMHII